MAKGIAESDIIPRVNVLTYHAWRNRGRQVKRGEHGVKVVTWIPWEKEEFNPETGRTEVQRGKSCRTAVVFHISQTDELK